MLSKAQVCNSGRGDKSVRRVRTLCGFPPWFSEDEKATELERRGADLIIVEKNFSLGFDCWKEAAILRPESRRIPIPEENLLPMARRYMMKPPWMNYNDLIQMEQALETDDGKSIALYQAMLIRLGLGVNKSHNLNKVLQFHYQLQLNRNARAKFLLLLLEWDSFYGFTDPAYDWCSLRLLLMIEISVVVFYWDEDNANADARPFEERQKLDEIFQNILTTMLERLKNTYVYIAERKIDTKKILFFHNDTIEMLAWLTELKGEGMISRLRSLACDIVAADRRTSDNETNTFLDACWSLAFHHEYYNSASLKSSFLRPKMLWRSVLRSRQVVRLLVESGADINSVDNNGNTCLHLLMYSPREAVDWHTVKYLTTKDANLLAKVNNKGLKPLEMLARNNMQVGETSKKKVIIPASKDQDISRLMAKL